MTTAAPSNRLARESSPYLLQHAHNPVDWYPWGEEAFAEARQRGVPIFLSIGYSTCYWCHVMEREVFENPRLAEQMNRLFVNIKVDREERPDVDDLYMAATQILSGRGGWPMSCFLEPEHLHPFWCGTYFPPEPRMGMPGFGQILDVLSGAWRDRRGEIIEQGREVAEAVRHHLALADAPVGLSLEQVSSGVRQLLKMLDRTHGGFGQAPKFPQPVYLEFLLDVRQYAGDDATRAAIDQAVRLTLDKMALGGMHDQVGGGFHRYSVDEKWLVPHFEKMLYDNAQLASLYARAASVYEDGYYRQVARATLGYVLAEMTSPEGAFYSAQDAEVGGREGANYIWRAQEVRAALGEEAEFALKVYGLEGGPNFRDPHHPDAEPANVLFLRDRPAKMAAEMKLSEQEFTQRLAKVNCTLYGLRAKRPQPRLDDKVITSWNGLMIGALSRAAIYLNEPKYAEAAARAADFILTRMRGEGGRLLRIFREHQARTPGFLEDYAFLADGLLVLHAAAGRFVPSPARQYLHEARELLVQAEGLFGDPPSGAYFDAPAAQADLFVRPRSTHDGAVPSGSSMMLLNLITCCENSAADPALERAIACLRSLSAAIARSPLSTANSMRGLLQLLVRDQASAQRIAALGPAPPAGSAPREDFTPVEIYADAERVQVGRDAPAQFKLVLRIAAGYHITAAEPGENTGLAPLRIATMGGSGLAVYADYPPGQIYGPDGTLRVYRDTVEFPVVLERTGEWSGRPLVTVTFQACTDTECLQPMTAELDLAVDPID